MQPSRLQRGCSIALVACALAAPAGAAPAPNLGQKLDPKSASGLPPELDGVGIFPRLGAQVPKDLKLVDQDGRAVELGGYLTGDRPVVLVFAYFTCPMLCTLVLNGTMDAMRANPGLSPDKDYRVVTVSFDGRDTPALAKEKRANYVKAFGGEIGPRDWDFLTGQAEDVRRLADAVGFKYRWIPGQKTFAHQAGIFVLTPKGTLSRVLFGVHFAPADLKLALVEASKGSIGTVADHILLFCFHYSPKGGKYVLAASRVMSAGGALTVLALGAFLALHFWGERKRRSAAT